MESNIPEHLFSDPATYEVGRKVLNYAATFKGDGFDDTARCAIALLDSVAGARLHGVSEVELAIKYVRQAHKNRSKKNARKK